AVERTGPDTARVRGVLTLLGRSHDETFDAMLTDRKPDMAGEVADFHVTGRLLRSDFGMTAGQPMVADGVDIAIDAHIRLK
ncbi:YceI family protein, partial [Vibrio parahaemolyticus]